jgi:DNA-3-methyladenine glycosylase I
VETVGRALFEFPVLAGAQAGLSWITITRKRGNYRRAFHDFEPQRIARYGAKDIARLMNDASIVRNRLKIEAAVANAKATRALYERGESLDRLFWQFVDGRPLVNRWGALTEIPSSTAASEATSKELKRLGYRFVGPTVCYAHMQATGMVNDHLVSCFRHGAVGG